jgi:hypothetical protein
MCAVQGNIDPFICPSCLALVQQCFKCKVHGAADPSQPERQEVFRCAGKRVATRRIRARVTCALQDVFSAIACLRYALLLVCCSGQLREVLPPSVCPRVERRHAARLRLHLVRPPAPPPARACDNVSMLQGCHDDSCKSLAMTHHLTMCKSLLCSPLHMCARANCVLTLGPLGSLTEMVPCRRCPVAYHQGCIPPTHGRP